MTMDRNGVNEWLDDDYSNTTCDCKFCKEKKYVKVQMPPIDYSKITDTQEPQLTWNYANRQFFQDDYDGFDFDLVTLKEPEPKPNLVEDSLVRQIFENLGEISDDYCNASVRYYDGDDEVDPDEECGCDCEVCTCDQDTLVDFAEQMEEDQIIEIISGDLEDAFINVLYSLQTAQPREDLIRKIVYLEELLETLKFIPVK
jgi:hypothetical protein